MTKEEYRDAIFVLKFFFEKKKITESEYKKAVEKLKQYNKKISQYTIVYKSPEAI